MSNQLTTIQQLTDKMQWLTNRQTVLNSNIANADTPGYAARDLAPLNFKQHMANTNIGLAATEPGHLAGIRGKNSMKTVKIHTETSANDGNTVSLEDQMQKSSETAMDYKLMTQLYQKNRNLLRLAVGSGR